MGRPNLSSSGTSTTRLCPLRRNISYNSISSSSSVSSQVIFIKLNKGQGDNREALKGCLLNQNNEFQVYNDGGWSTQTFLIISTSYMTFDFQAPEETSLTSSSSSTDSINLKRPSQRTPVVITHPGITVDIGLASDGAVNQWKERKREEKRLCERRAFLQSQMRRLS